MNQFMWGLLAIAALTAAAFLIGYLIGERNGVIDTERRWAEAVARADEMREYARVSEAPTPAREEP